jgi:hypothetical protein
MCEQNSLSVEAIMTRDTVYISAVKEAVGNLPSDLLIRGK